MNELKKRNIQCQIDKIAEVLNFVGKEQQTRAIEYLRQRLIELREELEGVE